MASHLPSPGHCFDGKLDFQLSKFYFLEGALWVLTDDLSMRTSLRPRSSPSRRQWVLPQRPASTASCQTLESTISDGSTRTTIGERSLWAATTRISQRLASRRS